MQASELRIGNWYNDNGIFKQVTPNTIEEVWVTQRTWCKPLTEEWLKRCNFNFEKLGFKDLSVSYGITSNEFHFYIGNYAKKINYVHQLQNLYFALTGEELTIKSE
jgi:hypothetical protein